MKTPLKSAVRACAGLCVIFLLAFLTIILVSSVYPKWQLGQLLGTAPQSESLAIGIFFEPEASPDKQTHLNPDMSFHARMLNITLGAIDDINVHRDEHLGGYFGTEKV